MKAGAWGGKGVDPPDKPGNDGAGELGRAVLVAGTKGLEVLWFVFQKRTFFPRLAGDIGFWGGVHPATRRGFGRLGGRGI